MDKEHTKLSNMDDRKVLEEIFYESISCNENTLENLGDDIIKAAQMLSDALLAEKKVLVCGEGLANLDAQRFASQLVHGFTMERSAFPVLVLGSGLSSLADLPSANNHIAETFIQQIETLSRSGDLLVVINSSGVSFQLRSVVKFALGHGLSVLIIDGTKTDDSGKEAKLEPGAEELISNSNCFHLNVSSSKVSHIQETHVLIINIICYLVEKEIFSL